MLFSYRKLTQKRIRNLLENEWGSEIIMTYGSSNSFLLKRMLTLQYAPKFLTPLEDIKAEINDKTVCSD